MYDEQVIDVLRSAHFWGAVTISQGDKHSSQLPFELKRIRIRGNDSLGGLVAKLDLDWEEVLDTDEEPSSNYP